MRELLSSIIFDPLNVLSAREKIDIAKQIRIDPTQPIVLPVCAELRFHHNEENEPNPYIKWYQKAVGVFSTEPNKCPYCGNTSQERDKRGNCISCGGAR